MAQRKLQTEIDRTLKRVAEGVELFESIYDKMQASTNQTQKEKLETDLKTQIKKLQRLRDQIKTWVASNDIKDKTALLENRRLIEMVSSPPNRILDGRAPSGNDFSATPDVPTTFGRVGRVQMEKFKACEKEMKTKAFSKEGLIQSAKLDPKAQEKLEQTQWLQSCVEELLLQVETAEAEIETLQVTGRKKGKVGASAQERLEELERLNERRKWHISRLEIMLRLLDNGTLSTDQVQGLKEDVNYFVEDNAADNYKEDEGMYDDLNLDEEEEKFGRLQVDEPESDESDEGSEADLPPRTPSKKHDEESVTSSKREESSPILKKAGVTLQLRKHSIASESAPKPPPNPNFAQQPMSSILKAGLPTPQPRPPAPHLPPIKYATAAAAAVTPSASAQSVSSAPTASSSSQSVLSPLQTSVPAPATATAPSHTSPAIATSNTTLTQEQINAAVSSPSLTQISTSSPFMSSTSASAHQADGSYGSPSLSEAESGVDVAASMSSPPRIAALSPQVRTQSPHAAQTLSDAQTVSQSQPQPNGAWPSQMASTQAALRQSGPSPLPQQVQQLTNPSSSASSPLPAPQQQQPQQQPQYPPGVKVAGSDQQGVPMHIPQQQALGQRPPSATPSQQLMPQAPAQRSGSMSSAFPGSLSDLVASFENVKQKAAHRMTNLDQVHKLLEGGYANMPQPQDTEKPKYYVPRNPYQSPSYYPQTTNPILSSPGLFSQLDVETLFYVFYFLPGTYQQYLAAKELKRQSWRFHVKYLTWFQRHSEPQAITDEYEQGVYVYFDWEGSWCQRKKSDFRFEYRYLSED
ncbi:hypothetical protein BV25DRAFT_1910918 [Artomyces pyxidatus]|uniref:Uncharacterized protein n=1 Tax=Artomyces pyxidatus TaxID=48021 RepID=A0ACB8TLE5_9AGAM|nr:hypothetical protein BV25DRAFT_1910918 [Artomyces pyxidatus]